MQLRQMTQFVSQMNWRVKWVKMTTQEVLLARQRFFIALFDVERIRVFLSARLAGMDEEDRLCHSCRLTGLLAAARFHR